MNKALKNIVLSNGLLIQLANRFNKIKLKRKLNINYGKDVFIGFSVICEGNNFFERKSTIMGSHIGFASYLGAGTSIQNTKIGRYTSIGPNVNCVFGKHPTHTFVSTHPAFFSNRGQSGFSFVEEQKFEEFEKPRDTEGKYSILIGNDVWIGANVTILDGVSIGDGAIVASNALVIKDIEPYTIVGGIPAKAIKKRFSENEIEFLLGFKWWEKPKEWLSKNAHLFSDITAFRKELNHD
jgi:acetyltransferase-like isoleucine patch superfamily enzyme